MTDKNKLDLIGCTFVILSVPVVLILGAIVNGWVLSLMWGWFVVPKFGLPDLAISEAIFVAMLISFLTYQYQATPSQKRHSNPYQPLITAYFIAIFRPLLSLLFAYVVLQFLPIYGG